MKIPAPHRETVSVETASLPNNGSVVFIPVGHYTATHVLALTIEPARVRDHIGDFRLYGPFELTSWTNRWLALEAAREMDQLAEEGGSDDTSEDDEI